MNVRKCRQCSVRAVGHRSLCKYLSIWNGNDGTTAAPRSPSLSLPYIVIRAFISLPPFLHFVSLLMSDSLHFTLYEVMPNGHSFARCQYIYLPLHTFVLFPCSIHSGISSFHLMNVCLFKYCIQSLANTVKIKSIRVCLKLYFLVFFPNIYLIN